ncbi:GntR family transcriptional regulator [Corynebacterium sp. J010B-136]|uniref:GntR family transcriptional regulator n=1 Tax=Corynebacterium sp. J010B-136 TaxID=2099401 RepID=UPI000CF99759|nr:GntR family transcriptional regulator [Corynebacterium sp. J010B-136]PQM74959.1 GntR family transcriptional regulator [Corynebacterium sp. J010B-136]
MALGKLGGQARVSDRAFDALYTAIIHGDLEAGSRLQVRDLAESLGTSMMPVREALNRLEEFGLVETLPYRGAVVKTFSQGELLEIYSVRTLLESQAVKLGIGQCDGVCVKELEEKLQQIQQALEAQDPAGFLDAEEAMLTCVFERAGNQTLMNFIHTLWARSRYYKMVGVKDLFETGNVALLYDEAAQFVAGATAQDEDMALDALFTALKRAEDGIRAELG